MNKTNEQVKSFTHFGLTSLKPIDSELETIDKVKELIEQHFHDFTFSERWTDVKIATHGEERDRGDGYEQFEWACFETPQGGILWICDKSEDPLSYSLHIKFEGKEVHYFETLPEFARFYEQFKKKEKRGKFEATHGGLAGIR